MRRDIEYPCNITNGELSRFDELRVFGRNREAFDLDARGIAPAITGTAYFVGIAMGQLFCGVLADRFGRQKVLAGGLVLYGLGAIASAAAGVSRAIIDSVQIAWIRASCGASGDAATPATAWVTPSRLASS